MKAHARDAAAAYVALAVTDTVLAGSRSPARRRLRLVTKPLLMPALGTAFALQAPPGGGALRAGTVAAQAMSGLGDIALLGKSQPAFLTGLSSFFGAHIGYTAAFASVGRPLSDTSHLKGVAGAAVVAATAGPVMSLAAGRRSPGLRRPVLAYASILSTMFATSTRLRPEVPATARRKIVAGTGLFLSSDFIIGLRRFAFADAQPRSDAAVMATYTAGQALISAGVAEALSALSSPSPGSSSRAPALSTPRT